MSHTECIRDLEWNLEKEVRQLFLGQFWSHMKSVVFFETAGSENILLEPKTKLSNQDMLVQIPDTDSTISSPKWNYVKRKRGFRFVSIDKNYKIDNYCF